MRFPEQTFVQSPNGRMKLVIKANALFKDAFPGRGNAEEFKKAREFITFAKMHFDAWATAPLRDAFVEEQHGAHVEQSNLKGLGFHNYELIFATNVALIDADIFVSDDARCLEAWRYAKGYAASCICICLKTQQNKRDVSDCRRIMLRDGVPRDGFRFVTGINGVERQLKRILKETYPGIRF